MVVNDQWFNIEENQAFGLVSLVSLCRIHLLYCLLAHTSKIELKICSLLVAGVLLKLNLPRLAVYKTPW
jgi:hypothetical protein